MEIYKSSANIELKIKKEINLLDNEYRNNKQVCVDYLVEQILQVNLHIPDVVLGLFSAKFE